MKIIMFLILSYFLPINLYPQKLEYRNVDYYFDMVEKLEIDKLKKEGIIDKNLNVTKKYKNIGKNELNDKGQSKYFDVKINILKFVFKDYLYQQHLEYKQDVYVLYFSMAGFDDTEWCIIKWRKDKWNYQDKIDKKLVNMQRDNRGENKNLDFSFICFNYDEGPKNLDRVIIFIKNNYLVMERGGLYHSLFDLKNNKLLINEDSPFTKSNTDNKEEMNLWIKENVHDKILKIINQ
ncbi:hypothetical protein EV143_104300 [Flavobacterium chryseum]|uniref:hypothetical protein n=1 Tax=Flavobacterium sp. P3160 TaxID=2512113 RepID=UPI001061CC8A|nr:hypothetical protein [Flavobacterium sp. P3160]TDO77534.1 hypothetical protein EV143_104300 [Flavobacterium sp. P3160]